MPGKNASKQSRGDPGGALLDLPKLVSQIVDTTGSSSIYDHSNGSPPDFSRVPETSPIEEKAESVSLSFVRRLYKNRGFSERATNIVLQSWRQSSQKQYDAHIRKWLLFCTKRQANPICPTISVAVDFLTSLYDEGLSYSSIISARCALSAILESPASAYPTFGEHPDVKRFMKGIFQGRPTVPRYCKTWDVNLVLQYIGSMGNSQELSLKDLTLKLVMLVALTTAQRGQSLQLLDTQNMVQEETAYTFMLNSNLKQRKPGKSTSELVIKLFFIATSQTHFLFDGSFYDQIDGVAMGSPLAPVLAYLFMGHHEMKWLDTFPSEILFYRRYVDDTFCLFHTESDALLFFDFINSRHPNIRFTMEAE